MRREERDKDGADQIYRDVRRQSDDDHAKSHSDGIDHNKRLSAEAISQRFIEKGEHKEVVRDERKQIHLCDGILRAEDRLIEDRRENGLHIAFQIGTQLIRKEYKGANNQEISNIPGRF